MLGSVAVETFKCLASSSMRGVSTSQLPWQARSIQPRSSIITNRMLGRSESARAAGDVSTTNAHASVGNQQRIVIRKFPRRGALLTVLIVHTGRAGVNRQR